MMEHKPSTLAEMARLSGVGEHKLKQYGQQFLAVIEQCGSNERLSETAMESLRLFKLKFDIAQVAKVRVLKESTIYTHLSEGIAESLLALNDVIDLPEAEIKQIESCILDLPPEQQNSLKPVFEQFEGLYSYDVLRCVRANLQRQTA
jgi:ATP-dependent DNA helicase RecQ